MFIIFINFYIGKINNKTNNKINNKTNNIIISKINNKTKYNI